MSETPYVLVIHGTWNGAIEGQIKWYQLDESDPANFCYQLNNHLEHAGMGHAVWRNLNGKCITFSWTGANEHVARLQAAQDLYKLIFDIVRIDPTARLYFVAHSHGGNVVLKAIQLYLDDLLRFGEYIHHERLKQDWGSLVSRSENWHVAITHEAAAAVLQESDEVGSRKAFLARWVLDQEINRLGRVVFLGTPFFQRVWKQRPPWRRYLQAVLSVTLALAMGPIYIALYIALSTIIILGVYAVLFAPIDMFLHLQGVDTFYQRSSTSFMGAPPLSPPGWPQAVLLGFVALPAIFGIYAGLAAAWYNLRHEPRNTNVYFDDTELHDIVSELKATGRGAVVESLVISAGILDEALLGISSGPLVQGAFTPAVHNIVGRIGQIRWSPSLEAWEPPSYKSKDLYSLDLVGYGKASHDFIYAAYGFFLMVVRNCFLGIVYPANWLFRKGSEKYVINTLGKVVRAATYGLPPTAFSSASTVVVSRRSQLEQYVREDFWDVARLLTRYPARTIKRNGSNDLYAFYWNEALLEERMRASWLRKRLKLPLDDRDRYEADIRLICLTIEDRLKGFAGLAELTHSQYYSNAKVIEQIAHFLACGKHLMS